jgi:addiction module HigA family antidote
MTKNVPHPGKLLKAELASRGMYQGTLAEAIGRPFQLISYICRGEKSITAYTALDLEKALGVEAQYWLYAQADYDLAQARARVASGRPRPGTRPNA